jgi:hypothetical protein
MLIQFTFFETESNYNIQRPHNVMYSAFVLRQRQNNLEMNTTVFGVFSVNHYVDTDIFDAGPHRVKQLWILSCISGAFGIITILVIFLK